MGRLSKGSMSCKQLVSNSYVAPLPFNSTHEPLHTELP